MKLLADENVESPIVQFLRADGHDVLYLPEVLSSSPDPAVLQRANLEERIVLTSDLDFGELVFHRRLAAAGIILMRLKTRNLDEKLALFQAHWEAASRQAPGHFVVITRTRIRVRALS
jgi:predicted nuclease of predicted toxin-antitoxin system